MFTSANESLALSESLKRSLKLANNMCLEGLRAPIFLYIFRISLRFYNKSARKNN